MSYIEYALVIFLVVHYDIMSISNQNEYKVRKNLQPMLAWAIILAIIGVMMTAIWPVWNLIPQYVTEQVKVVSVDQSGVWADTQDNYMVKLTGSYHNVSPGDHIMGTYDAKIKQRMDSFLP